MVVANQKSRQQRLAANSDDSLARSLHKDVDYPAINVSRRSPDERDRDLSTLGPDSRYPSPAGVVTSHRKRQNTLLDTGWHTCFKNNNYVFVRNGSGAKPDREFGKKVKDTNSDITFVIATTAPEKDEHHQKLIVSLQDSKPKIKKCSPSPPPVENLGTTSPNKTAKRTPDSSQENTSEKKNKKSEKKKTSNWLKKFTPGRNKLKIDATVEETTPIFESSSLDESPDSAETSPRRKKEIIRISPSMRHDTPVKAIDLIGKGPHTSTPKYIPENKRAYKSLPRNGPTPHRPYDGRYSVRRRLPYDETPERDESLFQISPLAVPNKASLRSPDMNSELSPMERRFSCHRRIIESPKFHSRLHPSDSVTDIPYADSVEEEIVSENAKNELDSTVNTTDFLKDLSLDNSPTTKVSRGSQADLDLSDVSFDERPKTKVDQGSQSDFFEDVSFDDRPRRRLTRTKTFRHAERVSFEDSPRRKITRSNTVVVRTRNRERCFSEPTEDKSLGSLPEMRRYADQSIDRRSISSSAPSLRDKRTMSCKLPQKVTSPMEEEENRSLDWHAEQLRSPDDSTVTFSPYAPKKTPPRDNPVSTWLKQLRLLTESECLNALQAKEIIKEDWIANALAIGNAQEIAEKVWEMGTVVGEHVEEMVEALKKPKLAASPFSLKVAQFCSSVVKLLKMGSPSEPKIAQVEARIKKSCSELLDAVRKGENMEEWKNKMISELQAVRESLKVVVKQLLSSQLQIIVECVDKASNINSLKRSVFTLILLGRLDPTFCDIVVKMGAVRSLLAIIVESKWKEMHPCALRALTVLSCVPAAIKSFEECEGVDCVCDVLCEESTSEGARSESAGLIAQITAPWTEGSGYVIQSISQNAQRLVHSITSLASRTESSEVFLLSSAALANLSFADDVLKQMKEYKVLQILVAACRNSPHATSLFIKDQVVTVLANMASKEVYRADLCSGGGLVLLLGFLQLRPSPGHGAPQLAACERIQQKAAIALARLCTNPETSNIVADMQGIQRLVKLCKDRKERNDSDSVLVACLAALRKIAAVRQKEEFAKLGAQELVEPRLWDAFLAHSSKRESYV